MQNDAQKGSPVLGEQIPWTGIEGKALRITHFTPIATIDKGKIKAASLTLPYAILFVESPELPKESRILVVNKVDFQSLWSVFHDRGLNPEEEAIVFCVPFYRNKLLKFLSNSMPRLHIYIYPKGHLEDAYNPNFKTNNPEGWITPVAEYIPKNKK